MKREVKITIRGTGTVTPRGSWLCVRCGRPFNLPKIVDSCETLFSICFTCFALTMTADIEEETTEDA